MALEFAAPTLAQIQDDNPGLDVDAAQAALSAILSARQTDHANAAPLLYNTIKVSSLHIVESSYLNKLSSEGDAVPSSPTSLSGRAPSGPSSRSTTTRPTLSKAAPPRRRTRRSI